MNAILDDELIGEVEPLEGARELIEKLVEAGSTVGDSVWDIKAARAAGVPTLAVLTGGFSEAELREAGASQVVESIAELRVDRQSLEQFVR